jgi:Flp pilus assembly protein TadB
MSAPDAERTRPPQTEEADVSDFDAGPTSSQQKEGGHGGHSRWLMIACCVPMLMIAGVLVATGAGSGFLVVALICTAMMAAMMLGMGGSGEK